MELCAAYDLCSKLIKGVIMKSWILFVLACLAGLFFLAGILEAGILTQKGKPEKMPPFLKQTVTLIGGVLATNLGAVLGISVARGVSPSLRIWAVPTTQALQMAAVILYVVGLLLAAVFWAINGFKENPNGGPIVVVSTLPELTRILLGVIIGAAIVVLGISST